MKTAIDNKLERLIINQAERLRNCTDLMIEHCKSHETLSVSLSTRLIDLKITHNSIIENDIDVLNMFIVDIETIKKLHSFQYN